MRTRLLAPSLLLGTLATFAACASPAPPPAPAPKGKRVDPATAGSISGTVTFAGRKPAPRYLNMGSDPACVEAVGARPRDQAVVIANNGALANVFVYVKAGLDPDYTFDTPTTVVSLEQKGCEYVPRVIGVRVGQPIEVTNDDPTFHNVHAVSTINQPFNHGQPMQGSRERHVFTAPEVMVEFKCDVHHWMTAWIGVVAHPFFAVTGADGSFRLDGLPPGTYTIEAWHETFGTKTATVTVGPSQAQLTSFTFTAAKTGK
jgi:plastocyanin